MEQRITRDHATLTDFGAHLEPRIRVKPDERFVVECQDNFFGLIDNESVLPTPEHLEILRYQAWKVNPVAGPIYVEGLKAGDLLVLEIEDIIPVEKGWTGFMPDFGVFGSQAQYPELRQAYSRVTHHKPGPSGTTSDGTGTFNVTREVTYPLRPFLGTICTAPQRGIENTLVSQGPWGGNMDCKHVCKGNKVMLNTYHDGGLLFFGDGHASQGDTENTGLADESGVDVSGRISVVPKKQIPGVFRIETPTSLIQVDSARNSNGMDRALDGVFFGMMKWLVDDYGMDCREAYLHFSVNPDVIVHTYQGVSGFYSVGVEFPKKYL